MNVLLAVSVPWDRVLPTIADCCSESRFPLAITQYTSRFPSYDASAAGVGDLDAKRRRKAAGL